MYIYVSYLYCHKSVAVFDLTSSKVFMIQLAWLFTCYHVVALVAFLRLKQFAVSEFEYLPSAVHETELPIVDWSFRKRQQPDTITDAAWSLLTSSLVSALKIVRLFVHDRTTVMPTYLNPQ